MSWGSWVTPIIAVYGVVQVWLIALYKKYMSQGIVDIYEAGVVEVGYSDYGPTVALHGTLRAVAKDVFVDKIQVKVTKRKDASIHNFDWVVFRSPQLAAGEGKGMPLELPAGFLVTVGAPRRYNICFADTAVGQEIRPLMDDLWKSWFDAVASVAQESQQAADVILSAPYGSLAAQVIEAFRNSGTPTTCLAEMDHKCYWEPGKYRLEMSIRTRRPDKTFTQLWAFELTQKDFDALRGNSVTASNIPITMAQGRPVNWLFSFAKYESP